MKYVDEYRDSKLIKKVADKIRDAVDPERTYSIMEVCGTHTMAIFRFGLRHLLPDNIRLISGPGCPVCVTPREYIDKAIYISRLPDTIITTFGDMIKVPGAHSSLEEQRVRGARVKITYSTDDALEIARKNKDKEVVFLGVGFETTAPTVAESIIQARRQGINNYSVLCGHKTMPEVMAVLLEKAETKIDGFLLPGHVSAIIGTKPYGFLAERYGKRCVVAGFEPLDIMQAVSMLIMQAKPRVEIEYSRVIQRSGNAIARRVIGRVFEKQASVWRGLGRVKDSGLKIRIGYSSFDAEKKFKPRAEVAREPEGCICAEVLRGVKTPLDCGLFGKSCRPDRPIGACMVSSEGTCAAYYKYGEYNRFKG